MGKSEENTSIKVERGSPPRQQEPTDIHQYPDWATIQAFYSHGVPLQQPCFNPGVSDYHFPPHACLWTPPQTLIPFYGLPYPAHYTQGLVFAHPAAPLVSASSKDSLSKSSDEADQGSTKKLRRLDGIAVTVGNDCAEFDAEASDHEVSQSIRIGALSDGSDGNGSAHESRRKSNSIEPHGKVNVQVNTTPQYCVEAQVAPEILTHNSVHMPNGKAEPSAFCADDELPLEVRLQEERHLRRERRKQANRESARRSRLRKHAELEGLMERYETMKVENMALKSEVNQLTQDSEKVKLENAALTEKLKKTKAEEAMTLIREKIKSNCTGPKINNELLKLNNVFSVQVKEEKVDA